MIDDILKKLQNPDNRYKAIPFWSWNGDMDPDELRRQVRDMAEAGFGGYFIHARAGLKTPYFSQKWMDCIAACIDEGKKAGISTWLYDENGYPSGFAGGAVPALGLAYQQKHLRFELCRAGELNCTDATIAVYRAGGSFERVNPDSLDKDEQALHAYYSLNPYYSDLLDGKVVRAFIDSTYEPYYRQFKEHFGHEIPGIFTDEPQYGRGGLPWSFTLPDTFRSRCGYDILDCLPAIYTDTEGCKKARLDFYGTVASLFRANCIEQLARWCDEHNCMLTGHILLEENMRYQALCSGSAMGDYGQMHLPGIDWLGRTPGNPIIVKQLASAAAQTGRGLVLSEMFAAAGWNTTLAELKRIAEWQYALGINLTCDHLYAYTQTGARKKDHPPGISYQSNWWKQCRTFNDTFSRLGMLMSQGNPGEQLLVIHPLHSGWAAMDGDCSERTASDEIAHLDDSFEGLSRLLSGLHINYHYADEGMLADLGSAGEGTLTVGQCRYRSVLIPASTTLEASTVKQLNAFADNGGRLFALEEFPTMIGGVPSAEIAALKQQCTVLTMDEEGLVRLGETGCKPVSITAESGSELMGFYHRVSQYPDGTALYVVNMDEEQGYDALITMDGYLSASQLNLEDCTAKPLNASPIGQVRFHFEPDQSAVLLFQKEPSGIAAKPGASALRSIPLGNAWQMISHTPNVLLLDTCRLSVEGGPWSESLPLVKVQKALLELGRTVPVAMEFTVDSQVAFDPNTELALVMEDIENFTVEINGQAVANKPNGWWKDRAFGKLAVNGLIGQGRNTIVLKTVFHNSPEQIAKLERAKKFEAEMNMLTYESELESIYLLGDFAVKNDSAATAAPNNSFAIDGTFYLAQCEAASDGELTTGGWPFFTGSITLEQTVELSETANCGSILLRMGKPNCAYSALTVNGKPVKTFLWQPYEADIAPYVHDGANTIAIELVSTDRNLFGPHHHPAGELKNLGPVQFTDANGWADRYSVVSFGLGDQVEIVCG